MCCADPNECKVLLEADQIYKYRRRDANPIEWTEVNALLFTVRLRGSMLKFQIAVLAPCSGSCLDQGRQPSFRCPGTWLFLSARKYLCLPASLLLASLQVESGCSLGVLCSEGAGNQSPAVQPSGLSAAFNAPETTGEALPGRLGTGHAAVASVRSHCYVRNFRDSCSPAGHSRVVYQARGSLSPPLGSERFLRRSLRRNRSHASSQPGSF